MAGEKIKVGRHRRRLWRTGARASLRSHPDVEVTAICSSRMERARRGKLYGVKVGEREVQKIDIPERLHPYSDPKDDRITSFSLFVEDFVKAIKDKGQASPSFYDGLRCQRVLDAVLLSSDTQRWTAIE